MGGYCRYTVGIGLRTRRPFQGGLALRYKKQLKEGTASACSHRAPAAPLPIYFSSSVGVGLALPSQLHPSARVRAVHSHNSPSLKCPDRTRARGAEGTYVSSSPNDVNGSKVPKTWHRSAWHPVGHPLHCVQGTLLWVPIAGKKGQGGKGGKGGGIMSSTFCVYECPPSCRQDVLHSEFGIVSSLSPCVSAIRVSLAR